MRVLIFSVIFMTAMHFANAQDASNAVVAEPLVTAPKEACDPLVSRVLYEVRKGDHLGKVLQSFMISPLWGKGRAIDVTARMNKLTDRDTLIVGQQITLPFRCEADLSQFQVVSKNGDRFAIPPVEPIAAARETASADPAPPVVVVKEAVVAVPVAAVAAPTPTPVAAPTPTPVAAVVLDESVDNRASDLRVAGIYGFHSIYATEVNDGSHASLVSTPAYGFEVDWSIPWSDEWRSNVGLGQRFIQFRKASVGTINDSGNNVGGFFAGLERRWKNTRLHLDVGAEQNLAVRATGSAAIVLDPITVPFAQVSIEQVLHRSGPFEFAANLEYRYMGATKADSYDVKAGRAYGGGFSLSQQLEKMKIDVRIDLSNEFQNSTIVEHDTKHLEMQIGLTIPLGGGSSSLKATPR